MYPVDVAKKQASRPAVFSVIFPVGLLKVFFYLLSLIRNFLQLYFYI